MLKKMLLVSTYENNSRSFIKPQGGLIFIKKYLEIHNDIEVDIIDPQIENLEVVYKKFEKHYDYMGFYCTYPTIINTANLINQAYKNNPNIVFILGGPGVAYEHILKICYADIVIYGESEKILSDLIKIVICKEDLISKKNKIKRINGRFDLNLLNSNEIIAIGKDTCNIVDKEELNQIIPLDNWEIALHKKYEKWTREMLNHTYGYPIYISRGCSAIGCNFCSSYKWFQSNLGVRYCSVLIAYNLIKAVNDKMPNIQEILFEDDNLFSSTIWINKFLDSLINGIEKGEISKKYRFILKTRVDLLDEQLIKKLSSCGEIQINVGVESYSKDVLYEINKTTNADKYIEYVDNIFMYQSKYNINFHCYMIFFTPKSKMKDLLDTIRVAIKFLENGIEISCYDSLLVFPGSTFDEKWKFNEETVNWCCYINPLYKANIYSKEMLELRHIEKNVNLPLDFKIIDGDVRVIYEKSRKIYKWLYKFYFIKLNWKVNTSFRIAIVKVLTYLIVINGYKNNYIDLVEISNIIIKLSKIIEGLSDKKNECMACEENLLNFDIT